MSRCANSEALNSYLDRQDRISNEYDALVDEIDPLLGELNDIIFEIRKCVRAKEYETNLDFSDDIKELIREELVI